MKKKIAAALIIVAIVIGALYIFNNNQVNNMYDFIKLLQSGHYYLDGTYSVIGIDTPIKLAVDGDDFDVEIDSLIGNTRIILDDGKGYLINDDNLTISVVTPEDESIKGLPNVMIDYNSFAKTGEGKNTIPGLNDETLYKYYEYTHTESNMMMRYYFKDRILYCIHTDNGLFGSLIIINELSKNIPNDRFKLPGNYERI